MDLKDHIAEIQNALRAGLFPNEAAVKQGVVLRLLQAPAWPVFDSQRVWPEYSVQGTRVDFALCHPTGKPSVFVEVKQVGQAEGADRQLFEYAFHSGIPMAVLTDGQTWHFYLPGEQGQYQERRVYKPDLWHRIQRTVVLGRLPREVGRVNWKRLALFSGAASSELGAPVRF